MLSVCCPSVVRSLSFCRLSVAYCLSVVHLLTFRCPSVDTPHAVITLHCPSSICQLSASLMLYFPLNFTIPEPLFLLHNCDSRPLVDVLYIRLDTSPHVGRNRPQERLPHLDGSSKTSDAVPPTRHALTAKPKRHTAVCA